MSNPQEQVEKESTPQVSAVETVLRVLSPKNNNVNLAVIDPQNSFCQKPSKGKSAPNTSELFVPNADKDCERLAKFISSANGKLNDILVTLDTHPLGGLHIAHPCWFVDKDGKNVEPFSVIDIADDGSFVQSKFNLEKNGYVEVGPVNVFDQSVKVATSNYLSSLKKTKKFRHTIWPTHCLEGTLGHAIEKNIYDALAKWSIENKALVEIVQKGKCHIAEHFSAFKAEVEFAEFPETGPNEKVANFFCFGGTVLVAGEALSHCVRYTIEDALDYMDDPSKIIVLKDATSVVPGFEKQTQEFIKNVSEKGVKFLSCEEVLAIL